MATVTLFVSDFATGNLPPVCAISGRPGQVWGKFAFKNVPPRAQAVAGGAHVAALMAGAGAGFLGALIEDLSALRAKGYLPLTHRMWRVVRIARVGPGIAMVAGLLVAVAGLGNTGPGAVSAVAFAVFLLAIPVGALVNRRFQPRGTLGRVHGILMLKLTNLHPAFVTAELERQRKALEDGQWPPGFVGPALVPLRFREPVAGVVRRMANIDIHRDRLISLTPDTWDSALCGKFAEPGRWWVAIPLWTADEDELWIDGTVLEDGGELALELNISE